MVENCPRPEGGVPPLGRIEKVKILEILLPIVFPVVFDV